MKDNKDFLGKIIAVKVDRMLGSKHSEKYPNHIYPINYGYVPNTKSGDRKELDCYILGVYEPVKQFTGRCIAIIHRLSEDDDKLVVIPDGRSFTNKEIRVLTEFQERFYESIIIREDGYLEFSKNIPELSVTNLKKSLEFYKVLGFKIEYERPENKFAFISIDEIQFMLQEIADDDKWDVAPLSYPFGNGINFQLEVENLDEIYSNLKNNNYKIAFDIEENWYRQDEKLLGNKEFLVQDPDGYLIRISQDLGQKNA